MSSAPGSVARRPTTVAIVPHTHWDREWYSPFQAFRLRLVDLLDDLFRCSSGISHTPRFLLDGQTAVLDDYLEIRPEAAGALRRLATSGRLAVGPWMILMDEFMVSGETIVRDLQLGMARADRARRGHAGRLPPRHVRARRPDAAAAAPGRTRARGRLAGRSGRNRPRPRSGGRRRTARACGPSTSTARTPTAATSPTTRSSSSRGAHGYELELGDVRLPDGGLLLMNGTDHQAPQPWLGRVVAEANARAGRLPLRRELAPRVPDRPAHDRARHLVRRAAVRRPGERAHGRRVEPGGRAPGVRDGRARDRASGRAAERAAPRARAVPARAARPRVAPARPQLRARLVVRVQRGRGRGRSRGPLPGGPPDRRRAGAPGPSHARDRGRGTARVDDRREPDRR